MSNACKIVQTLEQSSCTKIILLGILQRMDDKDSCRYFILDFVFHLLLDC